jgi:hypothetical protein
MTKAMVTSRVGSRSLESPSLGNLHNGFGEGREGHTCSALGKPELTANATRLAPTLHNAPLLNKPLPALCAHLNDHHGWKRERIAYTSNFHSHSP